MAIGAYNEKPRSHDIGELAPIIAFIGGIGVLSALVTAVAVWDAYHGN